MDLTVPRGPGLPRAVRVPGRELTERFSRASGPGGQSVNTADSRVEVAFDVAASRALTQAQRERVLRALADRLVAGRLVVVAAEHRTQYANRLAARQRMAGLLAGALAPPPAPRRATRPSRAARRRRLDAKRHRSQTKARRSRPQPE